MPVLNYDIYNTYKFYVKGTNFLYQVGVNRGRYLFYSISPEFKKILTPPGLDIEIEIEIDLYYDRTENLFQPIARFKRIR